MSERPRLEQGKSQYFDEVRSGQAAPQGPPDLVAIWQEAFASTNDPEEARRRALAKFAQEVKNGERDKRQVLAKDFGKSDKIRKNNNFKT
jgi:hypothetical protein